VETFAKQEQLPVVPLRQGQRKDDVAAEHLRAFDKPEGVLFIGKAQEKTPVFRTERRRSEKTGATYPWLVRSTAMVNPFYVYCVDRDFGPFFLKFSPYFPYHARLCLHGHEYAKRQRKQKGIGFEARDNGVLRCDDPKRLQAICDGLSAEKIDALLRQWLRKLPHPFTAADRSARYRYEISILQAEFSLTQGWDRPVTDRVFFEQVIRENLDIGRPSQVQLIFDRQVSRRRPGRFRTRVLTEGVIPSLHIDYKNTRIKQYLKEGRALRTETTINNTRDFSIGKRLKNLPALRQIGFRVHRRLLDVPKISHDCSIGEDTFNQVVRSIEVNGQRASALRFGDPRVQALFAVLAVFTLQLQGFTNAEWRVLLAQTLGLDPATYPARPNDIRSPPIAPSRHYRTNPTQPPLSTHTQWPPHRLILLAYVYPAVATHARRSHASGPASNITHPKRVRAPPVRHRRALSGAATHRLNVIQPNLTHSQYNFWDKDSS
jgi:hypothetical protein